MEMEMKMENENVCNFWKASNHKRGMEYLKPKPKHS